MPQDNDELNNEITSPAGHINTATYRFLKLLAEQIRRGAWSDGGATKSPAHWLNYRCGITIGAFIRIVTVPVLILSAAREDCL